MKKLLFVILMMSLMIGLLSAQQRFSTTEQFDFATVETLLEDADKMSAFQTTSSRNVILEESFESVTFPPTGWMMQNSSELAAWRRVTTTTIGEANIHSGIAAAASFSWNGGQPTNPDNWLISPQMTMPSGNVDIELSFWRRSAAAGYGAENYTVYVSTTGNAIGDFTTILYNETIPGTVAGVSFQERILDLNDYIGQNIYLAFRHHDCNNQNFLIIDTIAVTSEFHYDNDLIAVSMTGPLNIGVDSPTTYFVRIRNRGANPASGYTVRWLANNVQIGTAAGVPLAPEEIYDFNYTWTPTATGEVQLVGEVIWTADQNPANDLTPPLNVTVHPAGGVELYLGNPDSQTMIYDYPFSFWYRASLAQSIFREEDIPIQGEITGIDFFFYNFNIPANRPIKVWLAMVDSDIDVFDSGDDWFPLSIFTEVYDGMFPQGPAGSLNTIHLEFHTPFIYTGGNLVLYTHRVFDPDNNDYSSQNQFRVTSTPNQFRTLYRFAGIPGFIDPENPPLSSPRAQSYSNINLYFGSGSLGTLEGVVTTGTPAVPLPGVTVAVNDTERVTFTNTAGYYSIQQLDPGVIGITVSMPGYDTVVHENIVITENEITMQNVSMELAGFVSVSGRIIASDTDLPIVNAAVTISGFATFPTVYTDALGMFFVPNVFENQTYILNVVVPRYQELIDNNLVVGSTNLNLGDVMVYEYTFPPRNLLTRQTPNSVELSWTEADIPPPGAFWFSHTTAEENSNFRVGVANTNTFEMAHRYSQAQLEAIGVSGGTVHTISFLLGEDDEVSNNLSTVSVRVYTGGSSGPFNPGTLIHEQYIPEDELILGDVHTGGDTAGIWNMIVLDDEVAIPTTGEMWISVVFHTFTGYPATTDEEGDAILDFGNLMRIGNQWATMDMLGPGWNRNFLIRTMAITETGMVAFSPIKYSIEEQINANSTIMIDEIYAALTMVEGKEGNSMQAGSLRSQGDRAFESYAVYRTLHENINNPSLWTTLSTNVSGTEYTDTTWNDLPDGNYRYIVRTVFSHNNLSDPAISRGIAKLPEGIVYIGDPTSTSLSISSPFYYPARASIAQTIYPEEEIYAGGVLTDITYRLSGQGTVPVNANHRVYAGVTQQSTFQTSTSWIPFEYFTLVYEGPLPTSSLGVYEVNVPLDTPYQYGGGGNLVIMTQRMNIGNSQQGNNWQHTPTPGSNRTIYDYGDVDYDPENLNLGLILPSTANTKLIFDTSGTGSLTGVITQGTTPLTDVEVRLNDTNIRVFTNSQGEYTFFYVPQGTISITARKFGYLDYVGNNIVILEDQITTHNISMELRPTVTVSGTVIAFDSKQPIAGANVTIRGYDSYNATTNAQGQFTLSGVYSFLTYTFRITSSGYQSYLNDVFEVNDTNINLGNIELVERPYPAMNVLAEAQDDRAVITWTEPSGGSDIWFTHTQNDIIFNGVGVGSALQAIKAHRYTQEQLQELGVSGALLTKVSFFPRQPQNVISSEIRIYTGGSGFPLNPGTLIHSQPVVEPLSQSWIEVTLTDTIDIPTEGEFWIGVYYNISTGDPMGVDGGPILNGHGNVFYFLNRWTTLYDEAPELEYNWAIKGFAEGATGTTILGGITLSPYSIENVEYAKEFRGRTEQLTKPILSAEITGNADIMSATYENSLYASPFTPQRRNTQPSPRVLEGYNIYRVEIEDEDNWESVATNVTGSQYIDMEWFLVPEGGYRYIVEAAYSNGVLAAPAFSNVIGKGTVAYVTVNIATDDNSPADGAIVRFVNNDDPIFTYQQTATGNSVVFTNIWYGTYTLTVSLAGYFPHTNSNVSIQISPYVYDLLLEKDPTVLFEDFTAGIIPPAGWTSLDQDGDGHNWTLAAHPQQGVYSEPYATSSYSWYEVALRPDNWLITPAVTLKSGEGSTSEVSWYVATQDPGFPAEQYSVLISTTTNVPSAFTRIFNETLNETNYEFRQRNVDLTSYNGQTIYIAFRHHDSYDSFHFMIDDVRIVSTEIIEEESDKPLPPLKTALMGNYPNPFNPSTIIVFDKAIEGNVQIDIYNIRGQKVRNLVNEDFLPGSHIIEWNGTDENGRSVASGIYFYQMRTNEVSETKRMVLLK